MQWSRRFIGMKLFLSLLVTGWEGYADSIRHHVKLAKYLASRLERDGWTVVNDTSMAVVCFFDNSEVNGATEVHLESIAQEVKASGRAWLSTTRIRNDRSLLRACVTNYRSTEKDIDTLIAALNEARQKRTREKGQHRG
jgi:aromatic-L-amino-acid decarboxylase